MAAFGVKNVGQMLTKNQADFLDMEAK